MLDDVHKGFLKTRQPPMEKKNAKCIPPLELYGQGKSDKECTLMDPGARQVRQRAHFNETWRAGVNREWGSRGGGRAGYLFFLSRLGLLPSDSALCSVTASSSLKCPHCLASRNALIVLPHLANRPPHFCNPRFGVWRFFCQDAEFRIRGYTLVSNSTVRLELAEFGEIVCCFAS